MLSKTDLIIPIIFSTAFILFVTVIIIYVIFYRLKNKNSPKLTVSAEVTDKRTKTLRSVTHHEKTMPHRTYHYHDEYFATFTLENGQSIELWLKLNKDKYDRLSIGDTGKLTYQRKLFISFKKQ